MGSAMIRGKDESALDVREAQGGARFPWERQPGESVQAYARFVAYRNTPPSERSMRKLGISGQLAFRWARRWQWTKRAGAYDDWQLELCDGLAVTAQLGARLKAARLGSAFVSHSERELSKVKLTSVDDLVNLATTGVKLSRQALMLTDAQGETRAERAPMANVAISLGSTPPWLTGQANDGQVNGEANETKPLVSCAEQVIAGESSTSPQRPEARPEANVKRLPEKIVKSPKAGNK